MKIALVSTGLGRVLRGFESFTSSLFQNLCSQEPDLDVTLFQGGGKPGKKTVVVPNIHRGLTVRRLGAYKASLLEQRSFALGLYPLLRKGRFDIVHYNELGLGSALFHLRRLLGGRYRLLYCNGAPWFPLHYHHRCDFVQVLTGPMLEEARAYGIGDDRIFFVPYGVDSHRFSPAVQSMRETTRKELGIPRDAFVVLTVAALSRRHKRIHHILQELSTMSRPVWFLAAGQRTDETASLEIEADRLLPSRWRFVSWPHSRIHALYGAADVFVLASLTEGLPISSIEAMLCGLPLVLHEAPLFKWTGENAPVRFVNMESPGELNSALRQILAGDGRSSRDEILQRYSWDALIPKYIQMYNRLMTYRGTSC